MANSVKQAAHDLSSGRIDNLDQLWHCARQARLDSFLVQKQVATPDQLMGEDADFYRHAGAQRHGLPLNTPIMARYGYIKHAIYSRVQEVLRSGTKISPNEWTCGSLALFYNTLDLTSGPNTYQLRISAPYRPPPGKQQRILWNIDTEKSTGTPQDFESAASVTVRELVNPMVLDAVTAENFVNTYSYAQAQKSITQALQASGRDEILDHAFEAYWTLVVAAPDARGSAAKSHYMLQTILLAKGIDLPPARPGLAPDLEAMSRARDAWLLRAREVFDV